MEDAATARAAEGVTATKVTERAAEGAAKLAAKMATARAAEEAAATKVADRAAELAAKMAEDEHAECGKRAEDKKRADLHDFGHYVGRG